MMVINMAAHYMSFILGQIPMIISEPHTFLRHVYVCWRLDDGAPADVNPQILGLLPVLWELVKNVFITFSRSFSLMSLPLLALMLFVQLHSLFLHLEAFSFNLQYASLKFEELQPLFLQLQPLLLQFQPL